MSTAPAARTGRAFCADVSRAIGEPLAATASRVDHWILVEYGNAWARDALDGSLLSPALKEHLRGQLEELRTARLLFIKTPRHDRRANRRVFFGSSRPGSERMFELRLEDLGDLLNIDLAAALRNDDRAEIAGAEQVVGPLFLVCAHGKRDRCCALYGRPLYDALARQTEPGRVWQSTHVGGDRFAGNVVALPHGLYYGRVAEGDAGELVAAHAALTITMPLYRGRSTYPFPVQAAERAVRESESLIGIDDLELVESARVDGTWRVRFRTMDSRVHELHVVAEEADEATFLTCESAAPRHARRWRVTAHVRA